LGLTACGLLSDIAESDSSILQIFAKLIGR